MHYEAQEKDSAISRQQQQIRHLQELLKIDQPQAESPPVPQPRGHWQTQFFVEELQETERQRHATTSSQQADSTEHLVSEVSESSATRVRHPSALTEESTSADSPQKQVHLDPRVTFAERFQSRDDFLMQHSDHDDTDDEICTFLTTRQPTQPPGTEAESPRETADLTPTPGMFQRGERSPSIDGQVSDSAPAVPLPVQVIIRTDTDVELGFTRSTSPTEHSEGDGIDAESIALAAPPVAKPRSQPSIPTPSRRSPEPGGVTRQPLYTDGDGRDIEEQRTAVPLIPARSRSSTEGSAASGKSAAIAARPSSAGHADSNGRDAVPPRAQPRSRSSTDGSRTSRRSIKAKSRSHLPHGGEDDQETVPKTAVVASDGHRSSRSSTGTSGSSKKGSDGQLRTSQSTSSSYSTQPSDGQEGQGKLICCMFFLKGFYIDCILVI